MLTQDDILYFVITDRFSNGDPENDFDIQPDNPQGFHGGDFQGIVDRIPYLQHLGITALWITPATLGIHIPEHGSFGYHGYWPLDFERVDPHLYSPKPGVPEGSKRYLKELVDQLHAAGIKVVLDMVVNHTGYLHPALGDPRYTGPIKPHWFNAARGEQEIGDIGSWLNGLPDLKQDEPEVADYFVRVIADWIEETGVDCIRMDTAKHVEGVFWQYYKTVVKSKFPEVSLLGEVLDYDIDHISNYQRHFAFDSLFDFPLQKTLKEVVIYGAPASRFATPYSHLQNPGGGILDKDSAYTNHNLLVTLLNNHDLGRRFFTEALDHGGGNKDWAVATTKLAATLMMTTRGIPQIYYGDELALEGGDGHDNRRDMPWDRVPNGLEPDESHWEAHELYHHFRQLIGLRKNSEALKYGAQLTLYVDDYMYVYIREYRDEWVIVALNFGQDDMPFPLVIDFGDNIALPPRLKEQIAGQQYVDIFRQMPSGKMDEKKLRIQLKGRSASILMPLKQLLVHVD